MKKFLLILIALLFPISAFATTYYVRTDGSNSNNGLTNSSGGAWLTVDYAADNVSAGDVIRVQAGTYSETVTPGVSGTGVDNTVTFVADGTVNLGGFNLTGQDYIRVIGFNFTNSTIIYLTSGVSTGFEFWNNTHTNGGYSIETEDHGAQGNATCHFENSIFWGNLFNTTSGSNEKSFRIACEGCYFGYNEADRTGNDFFLFFGNNSIFAGNYAHDAYVPTVDSSHHWDFFQGWATDIGWANNVYEGNIHEGNQISDEHFGICRSDTTYQCTGGEAGCGVIENNIFRFNITYNTGNGPFSTTLTTVDQNNISIYHETRAETRMDGSTSTQYGTALSGDFNNANFVNNLLYEDWGNAISTSVRGFYIPVTGYHDYNFAADPDGSVSFHSDWTDQSNEVSNGDPDFNDYPNEFTIGSTSGAISEGGPLATTSGGGTGTTFNVISNRGALFKGDYTHFTQYGGNLHVGDKITVGGDEVRIASISDDAITVTESFTWADSESVYYGWAPGSLVYGVDDEPDIGALPYRSGGYSLSATYSESGGTVTVTTNDDDLVRTVIVYEDAIPIGADSDGTDGWSVSGAGSGTLDVRVYPLYPSTTLYATATDGSATPATIQRATIQRGMFVGGN